MEDIPFQPQFGESFWNVSKISEKLHTPDLNMGKWSFFVSIFQLIKELKENSFKEWEHELELRKMSNKIRKHWETSYNRIFQIVSNSQLTGKIIHSFSRKEILTRNNEEALGALIIQLTMGSESYKHTEKRFKLSADLTQNKDKVSMVKMSVDSKQVNECCLVWCWFRINHWLENFKCPEVLRLRYERNLIELLPTFDDNPKDLPAIIYIESWNWKIFP